MTMREKILSAFKSLGSGTYRDVLEFLQLKQKDSKKVLRRIPELIKSALLVKTGERDTLKGRKSAVYSLTSNMPKTDKEKKVRKRKKKMPKSNKLLYTQPELYK